MTTKPVIYLFTKLCEGKAEDLSALLLKQALGSFFERSGLEPEELLRTPEGKPYAPSGRFHLSLTHTGSLFAAVFAPFPIGIDGERADEDRPRIRNRYFDAEEKALPFSYVWCAKEAVAKLIGGGLSLIGSIRVGQNGATFGETGYRLLRLSPENYILIIALEEGTDFYGTETLSEK